MPDPTSTAAKIAEQAGHPVPEPAAMSTAQRIAQRVNTSEPAVDPRMYQRPSDLRRAELLERARRAGLNEAAFQRGFDRVLSFAANGSQDPGDVVADWLEQYPIWFTPTAEPTSSELVRRFHTGATTQRAGS